MDLNNLLLRAVGRDLDQEIEGKISHGLNLVLELKNPIEMPLLIAEIRQAQRKIDAGLGELNFVHFARFLPTSDLTALQVITEFDGPLAPYVLDFVIEIGDVFDMLLGYTKGTEAILPVADHTAEFLAFVEKHNTVTVPPIPPMPEWPMYAAYPGQTVLEIVGTRSDLPIPKRDRWATAVERDDLQGNILKGYGAERVRHFLLKVVDAAKARKWLADRASPASALPVTSFKLWPKDVEPKTMLNVGLTYRGMQALGIRAAWSAPFPEAYRQGALERAEGNFDVGSNAPANWWLGGQQQEPDIHVMVSLFGRSSTGPDFDAAALALMASMPGSGLDVLDQHDAMSNGGKSWFGFADGIANPRIATTCPVPNRDADLQPAASAGEFVLGADYKNIFGSSSLAGLPQALATNGSFCVVRVLAQDVAGFEAALASEAARLRVSADWLAAKLMGRWYEGAPVSLYPKGPPSVAWGDTRNDFDYGPSYEYPGTPLDHAGELCPVGAHIRRVNPRTSRVAGARYSRRLMRRGMHYDRTNAAGEREVGLFGVFVCADLERQFEFIQRQWINGDRFTAGLRGTRDVFVGTPQEGDCAFDIPMPGGPALTVNLPQVVQTRGSLYLFMPGLRALSALEQFATTDPPALAPLSSGGPPPPPPALARNLSPVLIDSLRGLDAALKMVGAQLPDDSLFAIARSAVGGSSATRAAPGAIGSAVCPHHLLFDPRRRDFQIDPYPVYAAFRAGEPVHYSPLHDGWFVFGYDNVKRVCTENNSFSAAKLGSTAPRGLFTLDDPEHAQVRQLVLNAWTSAGGKFPASVQRSIANTLALIGSRQCFDLVDDFARPVPRDVYFDFLGGAAITANERLVLDSLARRVMKGHDNLLDDVQQWDGTMAALELGARLGTMLVAAGLPFSIYRGSFLAYLAPLVSWAGGGPFGVATAILTLVNLTVAGYMSAEFVLSTGIRQLLLHKATGWDRLVGDPASVGVILPELLRITPALSVIDRFAVQQVSMDGVTIPNGAKVFGVLASANRDEDVYGATADQFDPNRTPLPVPPHLGLGYGTHDCMGRGLQKTIIEPALVGLAGAMPGLRLTTAAQPPWFENFYFRSFDHLNVMTT